MGGETNGGDTANVMEAGACGVKRAKERRWMDPCKARWSVVAVTKAAMAVDDGKVEGEEIGWCGMACAQAMATADGEGGTKTECRVCMLLAVCAWCCGGGGGSGVGATR